MEWQRPGVLRFMGSQIVRHDWATELKWNDYKKYIMNFKNVSWNSVLIFKLLNKFLNKMIWKYLFVVWLINQPLDSCKFKIN